MGNYHNYHNYHDIRAFGFYGGKTRLATQIAGLLDYANTSTYAEIFGGGAAVLLNKPPHMCEVYAEKCLALCCFWRCLSDSDTSHKLIGRLYDTEYDREAFELFNNCVCEAEASGKRLEDLTHNQVLDLATACFVVYTASRDNAGLRFSSDKLRTHKTYLKSVDRLVGVADRFNSVEVIHGDALNLLDSARFDSPDIMMYLDPIYLHEAGRRNSNSHNLYRYVFGRSEHVKLLERIRTMRCKILLSGYDDDSRLYDRYLLNGESGMCACIRECTWTRYEINAASSVGHGLKSRVEVIWCNFA